MAFVKRLPSIIIKGRSAGATTAFGALALFFANRSNYYDDINNNMELFIEKLNPRFRHLVDLLCFSDSKDLNISEFKALYREKHDVNMPYLWNRLVKSTQIFWENGSDYWGHRFNFILNLNDKKFSDKLENYLINRFSQLLRLKKLVDIQYDIELLQLKEFCKSKHQRTETMAEIRETLLSLPPTTNIEKVISVVKEFIPYVFKDTNEYLSLTTKKILVSYKNFDILTYLERQGISYDKEYMANLLYDLLCERAFTLKNIRAFYTLLNNQDIRELLKQRYDSKCHDKLPILLKNSPADMIEEYHLRNCKNILDLDESVANDLAVIYADKLFQKTTRHSKSNADRLIKMMNKFPQISPKVILAFLSSENKMLDMKYILSSFPSLKQLAIFV